MILVVGASGKLGRRVVRLLLAQGRPVRAMSRDPQRLDALRALGADVVQGDLRDRESLQAATRGATAVVSSAHALLDTGRNAHAHVDDEGQRALIAAAKDAGAGHFVFVSAAGASDAHPVDFWRTKARIERHLAASGVPYTIVRPTAFMEVHAYEMIGRPVSTGRRVIVFGRGENPKNFVAEADVARFVVLALDDDRLRGQTLDVGGPENLTSMQVVEVFERVSGRTARVSHVPLGVLRALSPVIGVAHEGIGRALRATAIGETRDQRFDAAPLTVRYPGALTRLEDWARAHLAR